MFNKFNSKITLTTFLLASQIATVSAAVDSLGNVVPIVTSNALDIPAIFDRLMNWGVALLVALAALFILWAAYMYLTAGAVEGNMDKAKHYMLYAVIAIFIAFLAKAIPIVVKTLIAPGT